MVLRCERGCGVEQAVDCRWFVVAAPYRLDRQRRRWWGEVDERDSGGKLLDQGADYDGDAAALGDVAPDGGAGAVLVEAGFEAGVAAGSHDRVVVAGGHLARPDLEALVLDNPAVGNYEELGDLYLDEGNFARARECYDHAIRSRADMLDVFYRRAIAEIELGDFPAAVPDLEHVVSRDKRYDSHRAAALLAHTYANTGKPEEAEELFGYVTDRSTASETYYNYAKFLASQGRSAEAREWTQKILAKKATMPNYLRRRERTWFRRANGLLKKLAA